MYFNQIIAIALAISMLSNLHVTQVMSLGQLCRILLTTKLKFLCKSKYPKHLLVIYNDRLCNLNDTYSVYSFEKEPNRYFISIRDSPIHGCSTLTVIDSKNYKCVRGGGGEEAIQFTSGGVRCIGVNFRLGDELLKHCYNETKEQVSLIPNAFIAFHYADGNMYSLN